jgi:hypothetical protein
VYLLGQACELEHGLMCEYPYTQFSLKRGLDEGRTVAQLDGVKAWETALISMTKQEMLHLALSTNILTAGFAATRHAQPLTVGDSGLVGVPQERRTVPQST